ncbi:uncharacterized protein METZ01_LOCUS73399 [marine metagenome]|uniref:Uncharacterized protein n=1 Tax=marine metagenome TaxID=408172 RepID=A0A381TX20_9ZZZZ
MLKFSLNIAYYRGDSFCLYQTGANWLYMPFS